MLPCEEGDETRSLLYCSVDAPCGKIPVFVTHLSWKLHQSDIRQQQVAFIAARIKELAPVDQLGFPPVLMGDFNAEPESDEIRYLRGYTSRLGRSIYFADCFAAAGDGSPGYTYARDNVYASARARAQSPARLHLRARPRSGAARGAAERAALLHRRRERRLSLGSLWRFRRNPGRAAQARTALNSEHDSRTLSGSRLLQARFLGFSLGAKVRGWGALPHCDD